MTPGILAADFDEASDILDPKDRVDLGSVGKAWRLRAMEHLARKLDDSFREMPAIRTDQQAMALIRGIAQDLAAASSALQWAADRLNRHGDSYGASQTYKAHKAAAHQSDALIGTA